MIKHVTGWGLAGLLAGTTGAFASPAASCGGFAMLGGAQINCSHTEPSAPTQVCTFSWTLLTTANTTSVVGGTFVLPPGSNNATVYQGSGFVSALSNPIVLCRGSRTGQ